MSGYPVIPPNADIPSGVEPKAVSIHRLPLARLLPLDLLDGRQGIGRRHVGPGFEDGSHGQLGLCDVVPALLSGVLDDASALI